MTTIRGVEMLMQWYVVGRVNVITTISLLTVFRCESNAIPKRSGIQLITYQACCRVFRKISDRFWMDFLLLRNDDLDRNWTAIHRKRVMWMTSNRGKD